MKDEEIIEDAAASEATTESEPLTVGDVVPEAEEVTPAPEETIEDTIAMAPVTTFYNGQAIVERLGNMDADGAEECKMADGSTVFVPKSVLGE